MRRGFLLIGALVGVLAAPIVTLARPITTPSRANEEGLAWYFEQVARKYDGQLNVFPDVDIRDPAYGAAALLKSSGVIAGFDDGTLRTWAPVSRAEVLKIAIRALHPDDDPRGGGMTAFPDVDPTHWSAPYVAYGVTNKMIRGYDDGTFRPDGNVSLYETRRILGLEATISSATTRAATRGEVLRLTVSALAPMTPVPITNGVTLRVEGRDIFANDVPVRGLMVNWQIRERFATNELTRDYIAGELDRMRALGIIGVSTEVGWEDMEPTEGALVTPPALTMLFEEASARGMWVSLLLAPHYTPRWVYHKHGDIWLKDAAGNRVPMGEFMTYSLSSPATEDQISWQRRAAYLFAQNPNLLALFLSNEQSYGNKQNLDFSTWTQSRWDQWRNLHELPAAPMPRTPGGPESLAWARFRQENLNEFLNRSYETVAAALPRFVPVTHKVIFYEATSAYAPQYGLHPTPGTLKWDIVGADIYGLTPNVYPAQLAHEKPIMVVETNIPGDWSAEAMRKYLIYNALQGISVQTLYRWNPCDDANCLFHTNGTPWAKAEHLHDAALALRALPKTFPLERPSIGILLPANAVAVAGHDFEAYQYRFDDLVSRYEAVPGAVLTLIWSDDLLVAPNARVVRTPQQILRGIQELYFILPTTDEDKSDGLAIMEWIGSGGTLRIDADQAPNLPWLNRTAPGEWSYGAGKIVICSARC